MQCLKMSYFEIILDTEVTKIVQKVIVYPSTSFSVLTTFITVV